MQTLNGLHVPNRRLRVWPNHKNKFKLFINNKLIVINEVEVIPATDRYHIHQ